MDWLHDTDIGSVVLDAALFLSNEKLSAFAKLLQPCPSVVSGPRSAPVDHGVPGIAGNTKETATLAFSTQPAVPVS